MSDNKTPISEQNLSQMARQEKLSRPLKWAIAIHVVILVVGAIGVPFMHKKEPFDMTKAVVVDLVAATGDLSAAPNTTKHKEPFKPNAKPEDKKVEPPKAEPEKPPSAVKSDAAEKKETPVEEPVPPKPEEKKLKEPKKMPTEKASEKIDLDKKKKPPKKAEDDNKGKEKKQEEFNSVLKNLLGAETPTPETGNPIDAILDETKEVEGAAPTTSETLSLSDMDALKYQLAQCWNVPAGAMNAEDLIVDIRIEVRPDRSVQAADIVDQSRYNNDDFFRAAADSARRAVFNPRCSPLALPPDKYDVWKTILIRFNPKDMFGG